MDQKNYHLPQIFYASVNGPQRDTPLPHSMPSQRSCLLNYSGAALMVFTNLLIDHSLPRLGAFQPDCGYAYQDATEMNGMMYGLQDQSPLVSPEETGSIATPIGTIESREKKRQFLNAYR